MNYYQQFIEEGHFHVYGRTIGDEMAFTDPAFTQLFQSKYDRLIAPYVATYSECIMGNHYHLIVFIFTVDDAIRRRITLERTVAGRDYLAGRISYSEFLASQFKRLFSGCAQWYNKHHNRHGSLFQKRFKRIQIRTDDHLRYLIGYVHHNPRHHKILENFKAYPFSSYRAIVEQKSDRIAIGRVLRCFDTTDLAAAIHAFETFHNAFAVQKDLDQLQLE